MQHSEAVDEAARQRLVMNTRTLEETRHHRVHLPRRDGLHEIRAHVRAEGFHERRVFLALRHHDDIEVGRDLAELTERVQTTGARHLLVEQDEIESTPTQQLGAVGRVCRRFDPKAFVSQEHPMWLEKLRFIVHPEHGLPVRCHVDGM